MQWDPKVSVLLWLERRRPAQSERHTKSNTSVVLQWGGVFFRLYKWFKNIYFKLVTSASHCQQLGLYSKCYTVCDFTLHWSHSKCPEVKTAKPLLSVLRTGKPNWRGVQLFRRTNRKMTSVQLLAFFTLRPLSLDFTSHSIAIRR